MSGPTEHRSSASVSRWHAVLLAVTMVTVLAIAVVGGRWLRRQAITYAIPSGPTDIVPLANPTPRVDRGEIVFQVHCAKCHGPEGHGDPDAIARQKPPPRDFAARPWRFDVTLDSIRNVTLNGIPSTTMPAHRTALSGADLEAVIAHTHRLATTGSIVETKRSPLETALIGAGFFPESSLRMAPELVLIDVAGNKRLLADERGRVVLVHFWGATCEHCLAGMPKLQQMSDQWQEKGLTVLNICADADSAESAQELIDRTSPQSRNWVDATGLANSHFEIQALPTTWLVDRSGRLLACARGMKDWQSSETQKLISDLLLQTSNETTAPQEH